MLVDDLPGASGVGPGGHPLEHQGGGPICQGAVDDITVPRNPAHVGGAPVDFTLPIVKDIAESHGRHEQVAPGGVEHSLGFPRGAGGVKDEERILRIHGFRWAVFCFSAGGFVVPNISRGLPGNLRAGALHCEHRMHVGAFLQGGFDIGL